ncbi:MAG: CheR family methyltransferase [Alphaproteobacteria bacterium]
MLVAIGASAGGLEALEALFDHLPDLDSIAYVVISHLSPDFKSVLDELLGRHTDMPVRVVEEGMLIRGGHIYVIPPGKEMIVAGQRLFLSDREADDRAPQPINVFLRALAREWGRRAVAVILSGSGSDGAQGCEKIRGVDGHVIVQAPETAAFESMPKAVLSSGLADEVLMPREIGDAIKARARMAADQFGADVKRESPETAQYRRIMQLIYGAEDLDFTGYKLTTFRRRISRRMSARDCTSLADYVSILTDDPEEIKRLSDDLLIGVTRFFRDPDAFDTLSSKALETLLRAKSETQEPLRIWVAGCATGEEAYSVAVQVAELRSTLDVEVAVQIFATDIRRDFLEHAGRGVYPASNMDGLPERLRNTYFQSLDGHAFQVDPVIRKLVIFAPHDLMRDPPFTKVDLITCRNVLIYFNADLQQRIMALFNFALSPSGFLLLGPSETLGELEQFFETIDPHWRLFRKARNRSLPYSMASDPIPSKRLSIQDTSLSAAHRTRGTAMLPAYLAMLKRYGPPCALITHDRQLVHAIGRARQYLRPPDGVVSLDILDMIDPGLRAPLATGIERCRREGQDIVFPNLALKEGGSNTPNVRLSIHPLFDKNGPDISHFVVIFDVLDADDQAEARSAIELEMGDAARERITSLEEDLKRTRESLQASIEEIETSNEELQSSNEELMAANEELQSTNEELSSVNQELHSVNAEYLRQNEKLTMLHNDMESLLRAVDVGVIFVDRDQVIRRFTSGAQRVFGLIAEDVGRRISDLRTQFREFDAAQIISQTLHSETPFEKEYQFEDGSWWLVRSAVVDAARHGAGVILAAFNIDRLKSAELEALENQRRYELVGTLTKAFTLTCAEDGTIIEPQAEWQAFTGQTFEEARGAGWVNAIHPGDRERIGALWHLSEQTPVKTPADADDEELRQTTYRLWHAGSGSWRHVQSRALKIRDKAGKTASWYRVILDAEEIVEAESLRRQRQAVLETVMSAATDEIYYIDTNEIIRHATDNGPAHGAVDPDGPLSREARLHIGQHVQNLIGADQYDAVKSHIQSVLSGEPIETRVTARKRGRSLDYIFVPHADEDGKVRGFAMAIRDLATVRALIDAENTQLEMMGRLIDRIDDEVILFTAQTQEITYANRRAQTNLRYPASQLSGRKITDLLPEFSAQRLAEIVQDPDAPRFSTFLLRYDGTTYDAQIAFGKEVHAGSEEIIGIMIGRDVTEQSAAASELRDRTADLAASNRDLEQFAMAISHDLKAPLRHITSFTGMLKKDIETTLNEGNREILTHIVDSATRMRTMIDSLLAYCRIQKHEQFTDVSLAEITHDAITNLSDVIASENPDLVGMDDLPIVLGDRSLLTMLMQNLIENALKYRGTETPVITFDAEKHQTGWRISIYDNGIGIDPAHGEDVFQVFRRLHPRDDSNSTGIGLAACRRIVDIHRGRIWLDPSYSPGACFRFELPAPAKRATPQRSVASSFR